MYGLFFCCRSKLSGENPREVALSYRELNNEHQNETITSIQRENFFVAEVMGVMIKALSEYVLMLGRPKERLDMRSYPLHLCITCEYPCESFFKRDGKTTPCLVVPVF